MVSYDPNAHLEHTEGGGFSGADVMTIRVTEPGEWAGHLLEVLSRSLPASAPLRSVGTLVRFKIAKVYLVHEYPRNDGRTDHYVPGDGALENLEILKKEPN